MTFLLFFLSVDGLKCYTDIQGKQITTCNDNEGYRTCFTKYNNSKYSTKRLTVKDDFFHSVRCSTVIQNVMYNCALQLEGEDTANFFPLRGLKRQIWAREEEESERGNEWGSPFSSPFSLLSLSLAMGKESRSAVAGRKSQARLSSKPILIEAISGRRKGLLAPRGRRKGYYVRVVVGYYSDSNARFGLVGKEYL